MHQRTMDIEEQWEKNACQKRQKRRIGRWPNAMVVRHGAAVLVDKIPGDERFRRLTSWKTGEKTDETRRAHRTKCTRSVTRQHVPDQSFKLS